MKAMQYTAFGGSDVLSLHEIEKPSAKDGEVLIKSKATTINPFDIKLRSGSMQKMIPVQFPYTPGSDVSGVVEAIGNGVSRLKPGDEVFATTFGGTYAEYVVMKEEQVAVKPANITHNEAVALAVPLVTAYSVLVQTAKLQKGEKILIHGAAGGVGSVMVQMAKALGAYVIGTASGEGVDRVKKLNADVVIDYKTQDFTQLVHGADVVADLVGGETEAKSYAVLKKGGRLISIVMPPDEEQAKQHGVTAQFISSAPSHTKLEFGKQLLEGGKIKPGIAKTFSLEEAAQAQDLLSKGGVNGKIVLEIQ